jgi:hypothetical protein
MQGKTFVYYSTAFEPYAAVVEKLKPEGGGKLDLFNTAYTVWIAYHAIMQIANDRKSWIHSKRQIGNVFSIRSAKRLQRFRLGKLFESLSCAWPLARPRQPTKTFGAWLFERAG